MPELSSLRLLWHYKVFLSLLLFVLSVQLFLGFKSLSIDNSATNTVDVLLAAAATANYKGLASPAREEIKSRPVPPLLTAQELGFEPTCALSNKDAISALRRAKSKVCRKQIMQVACAIQGDTFYPTYLHTQCPSPELQANKSLGCFHDAKDDRILPELFVNFKDNNTPQRCINTCLQSGFAYAGVEYGIECFCGNDAPSSYAQLPDSSCTTKCSGSERSVCGGFNAINIYTTGIVKFVPQTAINSFKEGGEDRIKIAFLLTLNGRAVRQVHRLIKALYTPQNVFYIHVDARQDYLYRELLPLEKKFPNIVLARERFSTIWGGASLLTMLLHCMRDLLYSQRHDFQFDFIINLSESDFPIKSVAKLVDFLSANRNSNFVKSHGRETQRFIHKQGLDKTFVECDEHMWRLGDRQLPAGIQIDGGSDWVALSRTFVKFLVDNESSNELIQGLLLVFRHTLLPAESFFHTALRNTQFCHSYIDNNLHITNWKRKLGCKCQYKHVVDWCGCSPNDFKPEDWPRLQATENKMLFFARKFEPIINQAIIVKLEEWLYGTHVSDMPNLHAYWQSLYCHLDSYMGVQTDLMRSLGESLARRASSQWSANLMFHKLLDLTSFMYDDQYKGFLIHYQLADHEKIYELETRIVPISIINLAENCKICKKLLNVQVSSDYDQKEQLARNYARLLGPYSEPVLTFTLKTNLNKSLQSENLTILWLDPFDRLTDYAELKLEESATNVIKYHKPSLSTPLLPGYWTVKLLNSSGKFVLSTQFLVAPLTHYANKSISEAHARRLHAGANKYNLNKDFAMPKKWQNHISCLASRPTNATIDAAHEQSQLFGRALDMWLEKLTLKAFSVHETCTINGHNEIFDKLVSCRNTKWSSYAPDPKSDLVL